MGGSAIALGLAAWFLAPDPVRLAGAALAAASALLAPRGALLGVVAALPLQLETRPLGMLAVSASELLLLAAALGTALRLLLKTAPDAPPWPPRKTAFDWPLALLLLSSLLSLAVTEYLRLSLRELRTLLLEPILFFYLLLCWFRGRSLTLPVAAFLVGAVGVAAVGLAGAPFGWGISQAEGVPRLQATYLSPNHLGLVLGRALPWLLAFVWLGGSGRWPALLGALLTAVALVMTFSLGAWLASAAAVLVVAWRLGGRRLLGLAAGATLALGLACLAIFRVERLWSHLQPGRGTTFFRLQLWQSAGAMVRDHPILGVGLDNFLYLYQQRYILPGALSEANLSHPHNLVLHFWLQLGLLGLAAITWLLGSSFRLALRLSGRSDDRLQRALAVGALGSLVDFLAHGLIDNSYFLPDLAIIFWLTLAVLEAGRRDSRNRAGLQ